MGSCRRCLHLSSSVEQGITDLRRNILFPCGHRNFEDTIVEFFHVQIRDNDRLAIRSNCKLDNSAPNFNHARSLSSPFAKTASASASAYPSAGALRRLDLASWAMGNQQRAHPVRFPLCVPTPRVLRMCKLHRIGGRGRPALAGWRMPLDPFQSGLTPE